MSSGPEPGSGPVNEGVGPVETVEAVETAEDPPAFSFTVTRPVGVLMVFLAVIVFGGFSARLPRAFFGSLHHETTPGTVLKDSEAKHVARNMTMTSFQRFLKQMMPPKRGATISKRERRGRGIPPRGGSA